MQMKHFKYGLFGCALIGTYAIAGANGNSGLTKDYLDSTNEAYPEAMGKITYDCNTWDFIFRGHGLAAGHNYQLRSNYQLLSDGDSVAVGNGMAGLGNNVIIKGNVDYTILGNNWNLWDLGENVENSGDDFRVAQGLITKCTE
ncbi:hypothetical protein [Shewanella sp. Isolate11]|uniref:hypothetical protein n=1 Tax=Shewanella sp. Isolate11 TaxID=2908530 RepID=UPI001EFDC15C|nr:hypothetical protein [Shewanella sp. Isolate11]MCG9696730.1 hypothetical protein [Shewanella sp. Isolate11]